MTGVLVDGPGEHFEDELLERAVHQRALVGRRDLEFLFRVLDRLGPQDVGDEILERARGPGLESGRRHDLHGRRRDRQSGEVAVEARERVAPTGTDDAEAGVDVLIDGLVGTGEHRTQAVLLFRGRRVEATQATVERRDMRQPIRFRRVEQIFGPHAFAGELRRHVEHPA